MKKNVNVTLKPSNPDELKEVLGKMTPDQLAALKEQISKMQAKDVDAEETAEEEEEAEEVRKPKKNTRTTSGISNNIFRKRNSIALFKKCSRKS